MNVPPDISVIVPSRERSGPLAACLESLRASSLPPDRFEVVVVDDGNTEPLGGSMPGPASLPPVRWVRLDVNRGPAAARNEGARHARAPYLAFLDDDCLASPSWLSALYAALAGSDDRAVGGRLVDGSAGSLFCAADQAVLDAAYAHYNGNPADARFLATANLAVPAAVFREIGGFDERYRASEDRDFCARWRASGRRLALIDDAVVTHAATSSAARFWRRHYAFGKGAYRFRSRHTRGPDATIALEPPHFYRRLLASPFRGGVTRSACFESALVVCSQLASACGFVAAGLDAHTSSGLSE
jgi:GT2 family glycosyltransferase